MKTYLLSSGFFVYHYFIFFFLTLLTLISLVFNKRKMKKILLATLIILFSIIGKAQTTTYYVSLTGNDTNDGLTEATAWRTITYAASSISPVNSGDTVYIKAGDYGLEDIFIKKNYAINSERISFIGYQNSPGDITDFGFTYGDDIDASIMPLINPNDRTIGEGITISDSYSITIKNIQIANSLSGITLWNSDFINSNIVLENIYIKNIGWEYASAISINKGDSNTIKNSLIVNATGAGMDIWGNNNLIENCKVYSNESQIVPDGSYTSMDYYIVLKGDSNTVTNCYAERDGDLEDVGHGLEIKENGENNLFVDCTVKNMISGCFSVRWSGVQNNEFRNCIALGGVSDDVSAFMVREGASFNTFNACISENCQAGVRYILSGEDEDYCGEYNRFNNCIIKNAEWAIDLNPYFYNSAPVNNNIMANCVIDTANYLFNCDRPNTGNQLINCIIKDVDDFLSGENSLYFDYSYCDFYNTGFTAPAGTGNISADPLFVDSTNDNFHLQNGSPCIDTGTATDAPNYDFEGTSRPQGAGYDIGAFEYSNTNSVVENTSFKLNIFPNPTKGKVFFSKLLLNRKYQIFSSLGIVVKSGKIIGDGMDLEELNTGIFMIKIEGNNTRETKLIKLIKE